MNSYWFEVIRVSDNVLYDTIEGWGYDYQSAFIAAVKMVSKWENANEFYIPAYPEYFNS
jgi:hypothetical protein